MKKMKRLLLLALLLPSALAVTAGNVTMKTVRDVGQTLSIAVNAGIPLTLTWGDGTVETTVSTGLLQDFTVKDASLTLSSDQDITSLYLADNELSELSVAGIGSTLRRLFCPGNILTTLNLSACTHLLSLDCQGNRLSSLNIVSSELEDLNEADNRLTNTGLRSGTGLTSVICANNRLTALNSVGNQTGLQTLFFQGNSVSAATLSRCVELINVLGFENNLSAFNAAPLTKLQNLWLGDNRLTSLDLTDNTELVSLCVQNNKIAELVTTSANSRALKFIDLSNNQLFFNSFPTIYKSGSQTYSIEGAVAPQEPFKLLSDMDVNVRSEQLTSILGRNAWSAPTALKLVFRNDKDEELQAGTDYTYAGYRITFLKPHTGVVITATSPNYPGVELTTVPINVSDPTGIQQIENGELETENAAIYDIQGRKVGQERLTKGIYIVNGKKVVVK